MAEASLGISGRGGEGDDGAADVAAADEDVAGARLDFENEKAAFVANVTRLGADSFALRHSLEVVHFNARADADVAGRQVRANGFGGGDFH